MAKQPVGFRKVMNAFRLLMTFLVFFQGLSIAISQKSTPVSEVESNIMKVAIHYDLEKDRLFDSTVYETLVLQKQTKKQGLAIIDMTTNPDSIRYYAVAYGESGLAELIRQDHSWLKIIKKFNGQAEETDRIKKGTLQMEGFEIELISKHDVQRMFKRKGGWERFYNKYPTSNGLYQISRPVIQDGKAILYLSHSRGGLSGFGSVIFLERKARWEVIHYVELWVS